MWALGHWQKNAPWCLTPVGERAHQRSALQAMSTLHHALLTSPKMGKKAEEEQVLRREGEGQCRASHGDRGEWKWTRALPIDQIFSFYTQHFCWPPLDDIERPWVIGLLSVQAKRGLNGIGLGCSLVRVGERSRLPRGDQIWPVDQVYY